MRKRLLLSIKSSEIFFPERRGLSWRHGNSKHPPTRKRFRLRSNCGATSRRGRRNPKSLAQTRQEEKFCRDCEFMLRLELFLVSRMSRQGGPKQYQNPKHTKTEVHRFRRLTQILQGPMSCFCHSCFGHSNLFRVSEFEFRI